MVRAHALLLAVLALPVLAAPAAVAAPAPAAPVLGAPFQEDVAARYHALSAADDHAGLVALWSAHPDRILVTIDADLEQSLALREAGDAEGAAVDEDAIAQLHRRALFGARAASEATSDPIFVDYTSSFIGWTREQQHAFRGGQAAFGRARQASAAGDHEAAAAAGRECLDLAEPLGDWWGMAMGLSALGAAQQALGRHEEALASLSRARQIHHALGLFGSALGNMRAMVASCTEVGRDRRALEIARQGRALAERLGVSAAVADFDKLANALAGELDD